jgi:hypothetical protein
MTKNSQKIEDKNWLKINIFFGTRTCPNSSTSYMNTSVYKNSIGFTQVNCNVLRLLN